MSKPIKTKLNQLTRLPISIVDCAAIEADRAREVGEVGEDGEAGHSARAFRWGRWLRGALGYALREVSCTGACGSVDPLDIPEEKVCSEVSCAYARGFLGLGVSQGSPAAYRLSPAHTMSGARCFNLTMFGALAEDHLIWLWGVQRALRRGLGEARSLYLLQRAVDVVSGDLLWDIEGFTFPQLPRVEALSEVLERRLSGVDSRPARVSVHLKTPLETRKALDESGDPLDLYALLNLIVRRLEGLYETYQAPLDAEEEHRRISVRELRGLVEGSAVSRSGLHRVRDLRRRQMRQLPLYFGAVTYDLPSDRGRAQQIMRLLKLGELIGIGRGGVEGKGTIEVRPDPR